MRFWALLQSLLLGAHPFALSPIFSPADDAPSQLPISTPADDSLANHTASLSLRVLSYNVRYATSRLAKNEKPWRDRLPLILNQLSHETRAMTSDDSPASAFIGLQEVLHNQLVDVLDGLNGISSSSSSVPASGPVWAHIGVGRNDGKRKGEYSPILYPVKVYNLLHFETVWLSPRPTRPSKGWDAGSIRLLTVGVFEHKATKRRVLACNTHLDDGGSLSRLNSVKIILDTIERMRKDWSQSTTDEKSGDQVVLPLPVFLTGDFNSLPTAEAYLALHSSGMMQDVWDLVDPKDRYGEDITYTGFDRTKDLDWQGRLDFIWLGPGGSAQSARAHTSKPDSRVVWEVKGYGVLPNKFEDGIYSSDHRCVVSDLLLR